MTTPHFHNNDTTTAPPLYFASCPDGLNAHVCRMLLKTVKENGDGLFPPDKFDIAVYFDCPTMCARNTIAFRLIDSTRLQQKNDNNKEPRGFDSVLLSRAQLQCFLTKIRAIDWVMVCMHSAPEMLKQFIPENQTDEMFKQKLFSPVPNQNEKFPSTCGDGLQQTTVSEMKTDADGHAVKNSTLFQKRRKDAQVTKGGPQSVNEVFTENEVFALKAVRDKVILPFLPKTKESAENEEENSNDEQPLPSNDADRIADDERIRDMFKIKLKNLTEKCVELYDIGEVVSEYHKNHQHRDQNGGDDDNNAPSFSLPPVLLCRVSGDRNDKRQNYNSLELAKVFADFVIVSNDPYWQASMRFFQVEFMVVSDTDSCVAGIILHGPNVPKFDPPSSSNHKRLAEERQQKENNNKKKEEGLQVQQDAAATSSSTSTSNQQEKEKETPPPPRIEEEPMFRVQGAMERKRVENSHILAKLKHQDQLVLAKRDQEEKKKKNEGEEDKQKQKEQDTPLPSSTFTAKVPPPSHFKQDIRSIRSEKCNMHQGIAEFMCELGQITKDDIVMDPMAGAGTIGMEAIVRGMMGNNNDNSDATKKENENTNFSSSSCSSSSPRLLPLAVLTGDIEFEDAQVQRKNFNKDLVLEAAGNFKWIPSSPSSASSTTKSNDIMYDTSSILQMREKLLRFGLQRCAGGCGFNWDATRLPLRSGVINVIISDLPFGHRCGNKKQNLKLYPAFLREFYRVLSDENGRAILLTLERGLMKDVLAKLVIADVEKEEENSDQQKKRPADPRLKEDVLKQEENSQLANSVNNKYKTSSTLVPPRGGRPMFIQPRPEFCIDMGGLYPYCFVLVKNSSK